MSHFPLSDMFIRFVIITVAAVVWCSLSIPVEGVDNVTEEDVAGAKNCLAAIVEVQKNPNNEEIVKRFVEHCTEFIDGMNLSETQMGILEKSGYKRSKKSDDKVEKNDIGDKVTDKKDKTKESDHTVSPDKKDKTKESDQTVSPGKKDKTKESDQTVSPDKKDHTQDSRIPDMKDKDDGNDNITHKEEDVKKEREDIKQPKLNKRKDKHLKKIQKDAPKSDGKSEAEKTETQAQEEKISEPEVITQTKLPESKSQDEKNPQSEQEQSQNLEDDLTLFDFPTFGISEMTPEERARTIEELKEVQRILKMHKASRPEVQMHANIPDPISQGIPQPQYGQQQFGQGNGFPQPIDQQNFPPFPQQAEFAEHFQHHHPEWNAQFQDPAFAANMKFDQGNGFPKPTEQQKFPPFPQQAEFAEHFQYHHFGQGIPQMPPAPEWVATFPDPKFGEGIPQPNNEASWNTINEAAQAPDQQQTQSPNVAPSAEELSIKRKIDEL